MSSESDGEEPVAIHSVSTFIEMPEGASLSDNDDKDKHDINDPHRALDIDLDLPLRTDEILPKQSYKRFNEIPPKLAANNEIRTEAINAEKPSSRGKKEKKRDKDRENKKKAKRNSENETDLMGTPVKHQKEKHKKEKKDKKTKEKKLKDSKTGYEEAIGISTPSKEVY